MPKKTEVDSLKFGSPGFGIRFTAADNQSVSRIRLSQDSSGSHSAMSNRAVATRLDGPAESVHAWQLCLRRVGSCAGKIEPLFNGLGLDVNSHLYGETIGTVNDPGGRHRRSDQADAL